MLDAWHALIQESSIQQHRLEVDRGDDCQRNYHDGSACPRCQRIGAYRDVVAVLFDVPDTCSAPPSLVALGSINGAHPAYRSGILNTASPEKTKFETAGRSRLQAASTPKHLRRVRAGQRHLPHRAELAWTTCPYRAITPG